MKYNLLRKGFVIGIIFLFVGASVLPSISGNIGKINVVKDIKESNAAIIGTTIYVDNDSECPGNGTQEWPYCKIQYGIDNASNGDTVFVYNGTYHENVKMNKSINLIGENRAATIIDGENKNESVSILSSNLSITGFTFTNGTYGIRIIGASFVNLSDCNVNSNFKDGVILQNSSKNSINRCNISNHVLAGIHFEYSSNNLIFRCELMKNWRGIQIESSSDYNGISQCNVTDNYWGIKLAESTNTISRCLISRNTCGIMRGINNYIYYNLFIDNMLHVFGELEHLNTFDYNYWDDYDGPDTNGDGIGDTPYYLYGGNIDWHPLMQPDVLPIVKITFPKKNDFVAGIITIQGEANDPDGTIMKVEIKIDNGIWKTANDTTSWTYEWDTEIEDGGKHTIYARSKDNKNYYSPEDSVIVNIDRTGPELSIEKPRKGYLYIFNQKIWATSSGETKIIGAITIEVAARDHGSTVHHVEFYIDNVKKEDEYYVSGQVTFTWLWDETLFWKDCTIKAVAYDLVGNSASDEVDVNIFNIRLPRPPG